MHHLHAGNEGICIRADSRTVNNTQDLKITCHVILNAWAHIHTFPHTTEVLHFVHRSS